MLIGGSKALQASHLGRRRTEESFPAAGSPLHACNGVSERQKVLSAGAEPGMATFSRKRERQSDPFPAAGAKAGGSKLADGSSGQKRSADEDADGARAAQRPKLEPINGQLPTPKVHLGISLTHLSAELNTPAMPSCLSCNSSDVISCWKPSSVRRDVQDMLRTLATSQACCRAKLGRLTECLSNIC